MRSLPIGLILVLSAALPLTVHAAWPPDGAALCTAANGQLFSTIVSDGAGGAVVTWSDLRGGTSYDIYARRVDAGGFPQWTADGVALCTAANDQYEPKIVSDGAGGAIVTWYDYRGGPTADIYAQRVDAAGIPQWTANGVALCTAADDQVAPMIDSDGAGGAIVTWHDYRNGATDVYAQRVNASGIPQWTADGVALCTAANQQYIPMIASDGAGGAIVTWQDSRGSTFDVYAQRVDSLGIPQWAADGVILCTASGGQISPVIVSDGVGGAIVAWEDGRNGLGGDVYAQRVNALGALQWTGDGVALCIAASFQSGLAIISDGANGAIVTWYDQRSGTNYDIYAQRVAASGTPWWTANGVALCTAAGDQSFPTIASDGAGGAIVTWNDPRNGTPQDVYAQRVNALGTPQWTADGVAVSPTGSDKVFPAIVSDDAGGAIVTWVDYRSGTGSDIYAEKLDASGSVPTAVLGPTRGPSFLVSGIYPNPFSGTAAVDIQLNAPAAVRIEVFDVAGRRVRVMTLSNAGSQRVEFDGRDNAHRLLPSGVYFYRVQAAGETITRKMVIAR